MAIQTTYSTGPVKAFAGMKADNSPSTTTVMKNTDVVSIPFGAIVAYDTSSPTSDDDVNLPAASNANLKGIFVHEHDFERTFNLADGSVVGEIDSVGLTVNGIGALARAGAFFVTCEDGCNPGDRLFVRFSGGTLGAARSTDAGGSTCIDATTKGQWDSTAAAGALAILRFDFTRK